MGKTVSTKGGHSKPALSPDSPSSSSDSSPEVALVVGLLQSAMGSLKSISSVKFTCLLAASGQRYRPSKISSRNLLKIYRISLTCTVTIAELERNATDHSTRINEVEATIGSLTSKVIHLDTRCEDLENRMQRNNICLLGVLVVTDWVCGLAALWTARPVGEIAARSSPLWTLPKFLYLFQPLPVFLPTHLKKKESR